MTHASTPFRIALCYGTRPQIIKASMLRRAMARLGAVVAVDTGQHYDFALNALLYSQLGVEPPDHYLEVGSGSHAEQTGTILLRMEALLGEARPDAVVVVGDTNSTLGSALAAAKLRLPVVHVEAGLRAADRYMPEEINRRVTDAVAGLLCAPSADSAARLSRERPDAWVRETGDVARDVLMAQMERLPAPYTIAAAAQAPYVYATLHRAELTEQPAVLMAVLESLARLPVRTVLALHPRTRAAIDRAGLATPVSESLSVIPAVGYLESLALARGAAAVVTDSGGLQREAYWLGVPCITVRGETEWVETVAVGANRLLEPRCVPDGLQVAVLGAIEQPPAAWNRDAYGDGHAADAVVAALASWLSELRG
jgi:UDP-N-acetylglucosamine 2-epimerase